MFSRGLVLSVLVLSLAAFPLSGCSGSSGGGGFAFPNQALVSNGAGISNWDVLLVGTETGSELAISGVGFGFINFTDRPLAESWTLSFASDGTLNIGMLGDNGCVDTITGLSYTFNGTAGTISGSWLITRTCDGDLDSSGILSITLNLDTVTDTISGTFNLQLSGHSEFTAAFNTTQVGTLLGTRVLPPTVTLPNPALVGTWTGIADLLTSGPRAGVMQTNFGSAGPPDSLSTDWNIVATFDAVGNVIFDVTVSGTALTLPCADQYTLQYTYDGFNGQITGSWFDIGDCEGDLVDTGSLVINFTSPGTTSITGTSFNSSSSGTDINSVPFSETDIGTVSFTR